MNHTPKSSTFVCCRERELHGFVRGDDFIFTGDSVQLAQMNLDGANVKSVMTPAVKTQEWTPQLAKMDRDRLSTFRSATMRASCTSVNRVDVQHAVKEAARFMAEPNERAHGACSSVWFDTLWVHACLPGRARRALIFSMASTCSKLEGGRRVRANHDDCLRRRCSAQCPRHGQQFSRESHGKAWVRKD